MSTNASLPSLVDMPLTPFDESGKIDVALLERGIAFHLDHGARAICTPTHLGESPSLTEEERRQLIRVVIGAVKDRVPVFAHVSCSGTILTANAAADAEKAGASAIVVTTPYYWKPPEEMLRNHFVEVASAVKLPVLLHNSPADMRVTISSKLVVELAGEIGNIVGIVDSSFDWEFLIDMLPKVRALRPAFLLYSGAEYLVTNRAIGGTGTFSPLSAIAPKLVHKLHDLCMQENYQEARPLQFEASHLLGTLKPWHAAAMKCVLGQMGRPIGITRPPLLPFGARAANDLWQRVQGTRALASEPTGW
jgi:4-hydroxy-tetrahydrodipicolinate synthase